MQHSISTPRLRIVPFAERHLTVRYVGWLNHPETVRYSEQRHRSHTLESCRDYWLSFRHSPHFFWAIEVRAASVGHVGNMNAYIDRRNGLADLGVLIGERSARGHGYALEAWVNVCHYLFVQAGIRKITAGMLAANAPMRRLARRARMRQDGVRRRHYLLDGQPVDIVHVALFAEDWPRHVAPGGRGSLAALLPA